MKKLTIILALIANYAFAQTPYNKVTVISVTDTVYTGQTIKIKFKYTRNYSTGWVKLTLWTSTYMQPCVDKYHQYYNDKGDSVNVLITPQMGTGLAKIIASNTKLFYIKSVSTPTVPPITTGIEELNKLDIIDIKYYDIYGIEKPSIDGLTIKITTYSNGYQRKEKILSLN